MNLIKRKFPCKCGHEAKLHEESGPPINEGWCNGEIDNEKYSLVRGVLLNYTLCQCSQYVPDNLKYLEEIYKNKNG